MYYPFGVTADQTGNVFIADVGNAVIRKVTPSGIISTYAGNGQYGSSGDGGPATKASLGTIGGVAVDSNGNLYIGDVGFQKIRMVAPDGTISTVLGSGVTSPWGLACDASGNVYIADSSANVVRKMTPQGALTVFAGKGTAGYVGDEAAATQALLSNPYGVSVDAAGNVYISDTGNNVIRKVDTKGIITTVAGNNLNAYTVLGDGGPATSAGLLYPQAAGVDPNGNLYICDLANNRIRKVTTDGIIHTAVGGGAASGGDGGPASAAQLNGPYGAAVDNAGNLYIADSLNNKVRKVASDGTITTIAGTGAQGYLGDGGPALQAQFHAPWGVAADNHGNIFIADLYNNEVRKVDASGNLTLYTGTHFPTGLAFDAPGNLYVAEYDSSQIWKIAPSGIGAIFAGVNNSGSQTPQYGGDGGPAKSASFAQPTGLAVDSNGNVYIADMGNQRVRKISASGVVSTVAGTGTAGFSGDGGPGTQAQLSSPYGVAVDPAGNVYIADTGNGRIRMVDSSGTITTVAGSNGFLYSGDGGLATNAVFDSPFGIAADSHGNLFVADQYDSVIRMLTPQGQAPLFSVTNSHPGLAIAGQPISSSVIVSNSTYAGASSGTVTVAFTLPSSLTLSSIGGSGWSCAGTSCTRGDALAPGAAYPAITVNATLAASASGQMMSNAIVSGGGSLYSASAQDVMNAVPPGSYCSYTLDATGAELPPSTASGSVQVTTGAGCPWNASADQPWVTFNGASSGSGPGSVTYSVAANSGAARTSTLTAGGQSFTIHQASAASALLPLAGVLAHFDSGATWDSTITVVNTTAAPAEAAVNFFDYQGNPVALPSTFPQIPAQGTQQVATWDQTLAANALAVLDTRQSGTADTVGSAQLLAAAGVSGFEVFANLSSGQQAAVPLETRKAPSYLLAFDNTGKLATGLAIANVKGIAANVTVILRDDTGAQIGNENEPLDALGHDSFMLSKWSETAGKRGTVEFDTPPGGQITVLGLRVNGQALTTLPVLANVATGGGSLAHFQSGGGWQTTFTLANTGASAAPFTVTFYDANGAAVALPLSSPELGDLSTTATVTKTLQPNASVQLVTQGVSTQTGSAHLASTGTVSGFAIFRSDAGQEAVVPLETRQGTFVLAFDNTNGLATGLAIANFSAQAAAVNVIVRDDTGAQIGTPTESLAANGHDSFMLASTWSETSGKRGTVEFAPPSGVSIGVIGIRAIPATGVVTTIPVLAK
jgi:sugar lactone lactonase YvrE